MQKMRLKAWKHTLPLARRADWVVFFLHKALPMLYVIKYGNVSTVEPAGRQMEEAFNNLIREFKQIQKIKH